MQSERRRRTEGRLHTLALPFVRLAEVPAAEKLGTLITTLLVSALMHPGVFGIVALAALSYYDWKLGSKIALARDTWTKTEAQLGKLGKTTPLVMCAVVLGVEVWISHHPEWLDTRGIASGTLAAWWAVDEARSILRQHRETGRRVPEFLDRWLDYGQAAIDRRAAPPQQGGKA